MHATNVLAVDLARENEWLRARVAELEAQLAAMRPKYVKIGAYTVDLRSGGYAQHAVPVGHLTRTETRLLACLAMTPGVMVPYETIRDLVWPGQGWGRELEHSIHVHVCRIRGKIDDSAVLRGADVSGSRHFKTMRSYGVGVFP